MLTIFSFLDHQQIHSHFLNSFSPALRMASSEMYVKNTKIAEVSGGKVDFHMRVRVINLWSTPDRANPTEEGALHMIFLDEERGRIHATVRKDLIPRFKDQIEEGCAYVIEKFMVAKNDTAFRSTPHKHKLSFMRGTKVYKVTPANEIPQNHFDFMSFQDILAKTNEDQLLDVIGHVVEKNAMKETEKNGKTSKVMDATLEDLEGNRVHCTLWGEYALKMQEFLDTHDPSLPVVIIFQLCKLKKYLGVMGISNSFYGSKLLLNAQLPEVSEYIDRMNAANVDLTQVVSQMTGPVVLSIAEELLSTPRMTIEDLIESTEKCCGSVLAWACEIDTDSGWFYQACTKCASRINFLGGQLYCDKCKMPRTAVPRFKVNLQVIDNTGSITFVMFDRVVFQVIGRTAQDLLDAMNNEHSSNSYPEELDLFVDKRILFKVEVTDANLYRNWRGYTVKKLSSDEDIINRFTTLHGINLGGDDDDPNYTQFTCSLGDDTALDEGVDSSCNEAAVLSDGLKTPTNQPTTKEHSNVDGVGASATKGKPSSTEGLLKADKVRNSSIKHVGKRSANIDGPEITTTKETKMACVKTEDPK